MDTATQICWSLMDGFVHSVVVEARTLHELMCQYLKNAVQDYTVAMVVGARQ